MRFHGRHLLEHGKDITMWRDDEVRGRVNIAAVVKATKIAGDTTTGTVITQLRQAFAARFPDPATGAPQQIHEAFVITPRDVPKEGTFTLHNLLDGEPFHRYVTIIDGTRLLGLITEHLGPRVTLGSIISNYRSLNSRDDVRLGLTLQPNETRITVRSTTGEPILLQPPTFADTSEAAHSREAFAHFIRTGVPTTIEIAHITSGLPPDDLLAALGAHRDGDSVTLRSTIPSMKGTLRLRTDVGACVEIPHVILTGYAGTQQVTLTNAEQALPIRFVIQVDLAPPETAHFDLQLQPIGATIYWHVLGLDFILAAQARARLRFHDATTGIEYGLGLVTLDNPKTVSVDHIQLARRMLRVQEATQQPITIPDREFSTSEDIESLAVVEEAIAVRRSYVRVVAASLASVVVTRFPASSYVYWVVPMTGLVWIASRPKSSEAYVVMFVLGSVTLARLFLSTIAARMARVSNTTSTCWTRCRRHSSLASFRVCGYRWLERRCCTTGRYEQASASRGSSMYSTTPIAKRALAFATNSSCPSEHATAWSTFGSRQPPFHPDMAVR